MANKIEPLRGNLAAMYDVIDASEIGSLAKICANFKTG
jgi:hypothetical protein